MSHSHKQLGFQTTRVQYDNIYIRIMNYALDLWSHRCIIVAPISPSHRKEYITKGDRRSVRACQKAVMMAHPKISTHIPPTVSGKCPRLGLALGLGFG